tara:strand:+ start:39 stop:431 length:393 start_codon:yes stop_codon:yes gene_type:complete
MTKEIDLKKIYKESYIKFLEKFMLKHNDKEIEDLFVESFNKTPEMFQKTFKGWHKSLLHTMLITYPIDLGSKTTKEIFDQCFKGFITRNNHEKIVNKKYEECFVALTLSIIGNAKSSKDTRSKLGFLTGI